MNDPSGHISCFGKNADDGPKCYKDGIINNKGHNQPMGNKSKYVPMSHGYAPSSTQTVISPTCSTSFCPIVPVTPSNLTCTRNFCPTYNPHDPDYNYIQLSGGGLAGGTATLTWDRYGDVYFSVGWTVGKSLSIVSFSGASGCIGSCDDDYYPNKNDTISLLRGPSLNGTLGIFFAGGGVTLFPSPNALHTAPENGFYSPQIGVSGTPWNFLIYDPNR